MSQSPGRHWVLQRVLDTVEEHLAQVVHGLEDVLHGVDPACLREEGERGTARGQGAHVQPEVHTESRLLFPNLIPQLGTAWRLAVPFIPSAAPSISGQCHRHSDPHVTRWEYPLWQPPCSEAVA